MAARKQAETVVTLVEQEGVLICGASRCPATMSVITPNPTALGWVLRDGWWLCPKHTEESDDEGLEP